MQSPSKAGDQLYIHVCTASLLILHCILHSLVDYPSPADADYKPISSNEETNIVCCRIQKSINAFNTHLWLHYLFIYFKFNCT